MCDERERLLDYLYDACEADERRLVERHLEVCDDCRREISELRDVRLNLLAWRLPEHESVWKPFAPARVRPWYREVPAWALAAAASVTFVLGLAGGVASRAFLPAPALAAGVNQAAPAVRQAAIPVGASQADLDAMERRILLSVRTEMDRRVSPLAAHVQTASVAENRDDLLREMRRLVATSEERQREALNASILNWLRDSQQTFVTNRQFNTWRKELGPSVHSALVAFQQNDKQ
jgi:hypothetical protein